ncbi:phenylacetic acid degradation protein [Hahella sp. CCB-MM4]|uniref:PaaI family thioesterase n=1 Tax=Hahella sp. (strain CCB-MM4) TaxID=1926491 RepID=UPI000B9BDF98|nr:PaaI family thioesterase [Hahella sp. CCB-MM4]OZG72232.1 phenylacetic acid degradation protein [Hahella sp. CCB-MM4]
METVTDHQRAGDIFQLAETVLNNQPFSQLMGAELMSLTPGSVCLELPITEQLLQQHGYVHGGAISYLADNALTFAGGSLFGDALTMEFKINYIAPAKGSRLIARADALNKGSRSVVCRCDIWVLDDGEERLCAIAQGTIMGRNRSG